MRSGWKGSSAVVFSPTPRNLIGLPVICGWTAPHRRGRRRRPWSGSRRSAAARRRRPWRCWPRPGRSCCRRRTGSRPGRASPCRPGSRPSCPRRSQPAGGVDDQHVLKNCLARGAPAPRARYPWVSAPACDGKKLAPTSPATVRAARWPRDGRRRADDHDLLVALLQQRASLADAGGLARALQAGHQNDRRRLRGEVQPSLARPSGWTSSSLTILISTWPGVRLFMTSGAQGAFSRTCSTNCAPPAAPRRPRAAPCAPRAGCP
jgi:hypothetical protein